MATYISAIPAYGRDYKDEQAVLADWEAGKDFLIQDVKYSGYISKSDLPSDFVLKIRYDQKREFVLVDWKGKVPGQDD